MANNMQGTDTGNEEANRQTENTNQDNMNKNAGSNKPDGMHAPDKNMEPGQKNKSTLIGKRHTDMENEGK